VWTETVSDPGPKWKGVLKLNYDIIFSFLFAIIANVVTNVKLRQLKKKETGQCD
jgi:uncharacterized membrane protein YagU involved in acid resistance